MTVKTAPTMRYELNVSPSVAQARNSFISTFKNTERPVHNSAAVKPPKEDPAAVKYYDMAYKTGVFNTATQVFSGVLLLGLGLFAKKKVINNNKTVQELQEALVKKGKNEIKNAQKSEKSQNVFKKIANNMWNPADSPYNGTAGKLFASASTVLGLGYLIGFPSVTGAGIKAQQPGTVLSSCLWLAAAPLMIMGKLGTKTKAFLDLGYAFTFAGFANEIHNKFRRKEGEKPRLQDLDYLMKNQTYKKMLSSSKEGKEVRRKFGDFGKFIVEDMAMVGKTSFKAVKDFANQNVAFITGKRKKKPDIVTTEPSKESMCIGSALMVLGSVPKLIMGGVKEEAVELKEKLKKMPSAQKPILTKDTKKALTKVKALKALDIVIGAGLIFESLGMMSLANKKNDARRQAMLVGGPMRIVGDFAHENTTMYGLRTLGGAAFEYYYTMMNKDNKESFHSKEK